MKKTHWKYILFGLIIFSCNPVEKDIPEASPGYTKIRLVYPKAYRDTSVVEKMHGVEVKDPYRWMERKSAARNKWIRQEQSITRQYLEKIPFREKIVKRLEEIWNYERINNPVRNGGYYYFFKNNGLQNQDVLYRSKTLEGEMELVFDPNTLSKTGTTSAGAYSFSSDGSKVAFQVSEGGSDWRNIRVLDLKTGKLKADSINWVKFSAISWLENGFFYSRYHAPAPGRELEGINEFHQVFYHQVGTSQKEDVLVFADRRNPNRNIYTKTTEDERFLLLNIIESTSGNALYFRDLTSRDKYFSPIVDATDRDFEVIGNIGSDLLILTNYQAANQRLLRVDTRKPEESFWEEIISESEEDALQSVHLLGDKLLAVYMHNASHLVKVFDINGEFIQEIKLPEIGTIADIQGSANGNEAFFTFTTFLKPPAVYQLDLDKMDYRLYKKPTIDFNPNKYQTKQIWYESYDGEQIPMFVIHKKGLSLDGTNPTLLYGYGGFNISILPEFNRTRLNLFPVILEHNGVCVVANIRGGGEFGRKWHQSGSKVQKQKGFDDFQSAAEYLIANGYTSSEKLAIYGRSNGGLLVGACMVQRPDLFKVALPAVGVLDMLRYHKFTIGWAWASDYGTSTIEQEFDVLRGYSPVHNVVPEDYPATLITTADHDDRVVPAHSYKFAAELQAKQKADSPILIRIDKASGHGAGKPTSKSIIEGADILSFMFYNMNEEVIYSNGK